jgi:hypothetical protein
MSPHAQEAFERDPNGLILLQFYQPGCAGDASKHSIEELQRMNPRARYLKQAAKDAQLPSSKLKTNSFFSSQLQGSNGTPIFSIDSSNNVQSNHLAFKG